MNPEELFHAAIRLTQYHHREQLFGERRAFARKRCRASGTRATQAQIAAPLNSVLFSFSALVR
jgi:hypothetical protein